MSLIYKGVHMTLTPILTPPARVHVLCFTFVIILVNLPASFHQSPAFSLGSEVQQKSVEITYFT